MTNSNIISTYLELPTPVITEELSQDITQEFAITIPAHHVKRDRMQITAQHDNTTIRVNITERQISHDWSDSWYNYGYDAELIIITNNNIIAFQILSLGCIGTIGQDTHRKSMPIPQLCKTDGTYFTKIIELKSASKKATQTIQITKTAMIQGMSFGDMRIIYA